MQEALAAACGAELKAGCQGCCRSRKFPGDHLEKLDISRSSAKAVEIASMLCCKTFQFWTLNEGKCMRNCSALRLGIHSSRNYFTWRIIHSLTNVLEF